MGNGTSSTDYKLLHKTQTGLAAEFFVAAELTRRGYVVTLTFGNTKAIDLIVINHAGEPVPVQVKGMQRSKSLCWNMSRDAVKENVFYVLVNLHADTLIQPEFFVLSGAEMKATLKKVESRRDYIDYTTIKASAFRNAWEKLGAVKPQNASPTVK